MRSIDVNLLELLIEVLEKRIRKAKENRHRARSMMKLFIEVCRMR